MILNVTNELNKFKKNTRVSVSDFRTMVVEPMFNECLITNQKLIVILDGKTSYTPDFLDGAFGSLVTCSYDPEQIFDTMIFICNEKPQLVEEIKSYINFSSELLKRRNHQIRLALGTNYLW